MFILNTQSTPLLQNFSKDIFKFHHMPITPFFTSSPQHDLSSSLQMQLGHTLSLKIYTARSPNLLLGKHNAYTSTKSHGRYSKVFNFWTSRTFVAIPTCQRSRRLLCRELMDLDHASLCQTKTFHSVVQLFLVCVLTAEKMRTLIIIDTVRLVIFECQ